MKAEQINQFILFIYNLVFVLILCAIALIIALILTVVIDLIFQKINGDKVYITPVERSLAERDFCNMQLIRTKINGKVIEITVSKKLIKWAFRNRFNYWLFIKYILFKLRRAERGKK